MPPPSPSPCKYQFGITSPVAYLAAHTCVEISSMAFLTGLILQAQLNSSKAALVAIAEVESRHEAWGLIDIWQQSPFAGTVDTVFPYANEILDTTKVFVVPGSCPPGNPDYPVPSQNLPSLSYKEKSTTLLPGSPVTFVFPTQSTSHPSRLIGPTMPSISMDYLVSPSHLTPRQTRQSYHRSLKLRACFSQSFQTLLVPRRLIPSRQDR